MTILKLIQLEEKTIRFIVKDSDNQLVDVSSAECSLIIKESLGASEVLATKDDDDFDKTDGANGILRVTLEDNDLNWYGTGYGILTVIIASGNTDKTIFKLELEQTEAD